VDLLALTFYLPLDARFCFIRWEYQGLFLKRAFDAVSDMDTHKSEATNKPGSKSNSFNFQGGSIKI